MDRLMTRRARGRKRTRINLTMLEITKQMKNQTIQRQSGRALVSAEPLLDTEETHFVKESGDGRVGLIMFLLN